MITYLDRVLVIHPDIQNVMYWQSQYDGTPWNDPYDGLVWENKEIPKPSKKELDAVLDSDVLAKKEVDRKLSRNEIKLKDLTMVGLYEMEKKSNPELAFSDYLDSLELKQKEI